MNPAEKFIPPPLVKILPTAGFIPRGINISAKLVPRGTNISAKLYPGVQIFQQNQYPGLLILLKY